MLEIVTETAKKYGGKIPKMRTGLRCTEGSVTTKTGLIYNLFGTFQTMIRTNTSATDWVSMSVTIDPETPADVRAAHVAAYDEWKKCMPGKGLEIVEKYAPFFDGIELP